MSTNRGSGTGLKTKPKHQTQLPDRTHVNGRSRDDANPHSEPKRFWPGLELYG
jgi:hypothetical protein